MKITKILGKDYGTREEVYDYLAGKTAPDHKKSIVDGLLYRENIGDISIEDGVIMPHVESGFLKESEIVIISMNRPINNWSKDIENVDLIIAIFLKDNECLEVKKEIRDFSRSLANEENIIKLREN